MFLILKGPERWFCETETSSPVITFLCIYKRVVSDEKYYILFVNISTTGCPLSNKTQVLLLHVLVVYLISCNVNSISAFVKLPLNAL